MNDLITNSFTENVNLSLLRKNLGLQKIMLGCIFVYAILSCAYWVTVLFRDIETGSSVSLTWYTKVYPFIALAIVTLSVVYSVLAFKGNSLIYLSIETKDAALFNRGYHSFFNSNVAALTATTISTATLIIDLLLR